MILSADILQLTHTMNIITAVLMAKIIVY